MQSTTFISQWADEQKPRAPALKNESVFYRNLEEELDVARSQGVCIPLHTQELKIDFSSCDVLSLGSSGSLRKEFLEELARNPSFQLGSHASRLTDGNTKYQEELEREIAKFHHVESALILNSGGMCNEAIFSTIPRPGDVIVYDELVHTTALAGMKVSLALWQKSFRHNDVESFIDVLEEVRETQPQVRNGKRSVIIAVEGYYSMDGDICPLAELVDAAKEVFPNGNAQFVIDEAHSFGAIGPHGGGLVAKLGLEKEIAIRMHTFGKALSGSGAVVLSNNTVRRMLINHAKVIICSIAPAFPLLAATRAGFKLLKSDETERARERLQYLTKFFLDTITANPTYQKANKAGILRIPIHEDGDWHSQPFISHICPVWTRHRDAFFLSFHLLAAGIAAYPVIFPIVPKGEDRVRLVMHACNTEAQVETLVDAICGFAEEVLEIDASGGKKGLPSAARQAYAMTK
jgi:8-amino-7-oxononanoate synthase